MATFGSNVTLNSLSDAGFSWCLLLKTMKLKEDMLQVKLTEWDLR